MNCRLELQCIVIEELQKAVTKLETRLDSISTNKMTAQLQPHIVSPQPEDELPNLNPTSENQTYAQALSANRQGSTKPNLKPLSTSNYERKYNIIVHGVIE